MLVERPLNTHKRHKSGHLLTNAMGPEPEVRFPSSCNSNALLIVNTRRACNFRG